MAATRVTSARKEFNTSKVVTPRIKKRGLVPVSLMCDDLMKETLSTILHKVITFLRRKQ